MLDQPCYDNANLGEGFLYNLPITQMGSISLFKVILIRSNLSCCFIIILFCQASIFKVSLKVTYILAMSFNIVIHRLLYFYDITHKTSK
ncbi:unnamed protein product [Paramecium octaurelia]|uniref:Uncharacterized protein n=1 Tax=Paramecium octaurelia TaxID=43137 RepID=A0A8S1YP16_PAROT|nr:unnamed protein product [Paramecium octaurelia]